jgi:hypothetical protein
MAERKSGPVKPPVIDLEARPASRRTAPRTPRPSETEGGAEAMDATAPAGDMAVPAADVASETTAEPRSEGTDAAMTASSDGAEAVGVAPTASSSAAEPPAPQPKAEQPALSTDAAADRPAPARPEAVRPETSRPDTGRADSGRAETGRAETARPIPPTPPVPPSVPPERGGAGWAGLAGAAIGGGVLGLIAALALASAGYWPSSVQAPDPRLVRLYDALPAIETLPELEQRLAAQAETLAGQQAAIETLGSDATTLAGRLESEAGRLETLAGEARFDPATLPPPDVSGLEAELAALSSRLDALAAGASTEDASAIAESFAGFETRLRGLETALATAQAQASDTAAQLAALTEAQAAPEPQTPQVDLDAQLRLPLLLSGMDAAIAAGRPFIAELEGLAASAPGGAAPSDSLRQSAASGLVRPDTLTQRYEAALPAIIAAGTQAEAGDWMSDALDWGRSLLALRPAQEQQGDTPEAVLSRLEAAIARRDFAAARDLFAQLPAPMQAAAGSLPADIAALAEAEAYIATIRAAAVTPEAAS